MPPSLNAALNPVLNAFIVAQPKLLRHVQRSFPGLCCGHAEDAVSAVSEDVLTHPATYEQVHDPQNPNKLYGMFKCVAWCAARGTVRRRSFSAERGLLHEEEVQVGYDGTQHLSLALSRDLIRLVYAVAYEISPRRANDLAIAVLDLLANGGTDGEVAERHNLPREYLNRAKRRVLRHFVGEPRQRRSSGPPARRAQKTV